LCDELHRVNSDVEAKICEDCEHALDLHHANGCDGNLELERAYWAAFEELPAYVETREAVLAMEAGQPQPCGCLLLRALLR
jgi:hypothetical protein